MQDRLATKKVHSKTKTLTYHGFILIVVLFVSLSGVRNIMRKIRTPILKYLLKDSALMFPLLLIILIFNYILSGSRKQQLNIYGVLYYVDLDRFLMQIVTFIITWFFIGIVFTLIWEYQSQVYEEYESQDAEQLHRLYENMYLYGDVNANIIQDKVQYHSIRQQFIAPTDVTLLAPRIQRSDFNFALFLSQNQRKIYSQILRINTFSIVPIIIGMFLTYIFAPLIITIILLGFYYVQNKNLYVLYTKINTPYQYNPSPMQQRGIQQPPYINMPLQKNKTKKVIFSKQLNLRIIHSLVFIQIFWFAWLFYAHRSRDSIIDHTALAVYVSVASVNVTILVPMLISVITYTHQMKSPYKISVQCQYKSQELMDKVSHFLRACNRREEQPEERKSDQKKNNEEQEAEDEDQDHQDQYSLTVGQQQLIKYAFTSLINNEKEKYVKQAVAQYKQQLIENPHLLDVPIDSEEEVEVLDQEQEDNSESQQSDQQPAPVVQQQQPVEKKDINEALRQYEQKIVAKMMDKTETSSISISQLSDINKYIDSNLPLWYIVLMVDKYFKLKNQNQEIKYNDLCNYSGYNQYVMETGDMYPQEVEVVSLSNMKERLMYFFSEQESQQIVQEYSYQQQMVNFDKFYQFIENCIVLFPK